MASGFGDKDTKGRGGTAKGTGGLSSDSGMGRSGKGPQGGTDNRGRTVGDPGKRDYRRTLLGMLTEQTHFVEGHAAKLGSLGKKASKADIAAQQARWDAEFALRKKIKPIRDPDEVDVTAKKKRTKQKQHGRVGTTTLSNAETLG